MYTLPERGKQCPGRFSCAIAQVKNRGSGKFDVEPLRLQPASITVPPDVGQRGFHGVRSRLTL